MVKNYDGDLSVFQRTKLDSYQHQTLVRAFKDDLLIELLYQMKQKRISLVPVEEYLSCHQRAQDSNSFTVGLVFLTDLLFLLRLPNFWELLSQPVSVFLEELYGGDQDLSREFQGSLNNSQVYGQQPGDAVGEAGEQRVAAPGQMPVQFSNLARPEPVSPAIDQQNQEIGTIGA